MNDDIVTRLRTKYQGQLPICAEAADEIEQLREWKELAYEMHNKTMRNLSSFIFDRKLIKKFNDMHKADWKRHE